MRNLTRDHRPKLLREIYGQDDVVRSLRDLISTKSHQSVLIVGPSGTGKTSLAHILGRILLCEDKAGDEPCGRCLNCKHFGTENTPDFIAYACNENSKVEEIAGLMQKARYAPYNGDYRVVVLDEIHVLSGRAYDALLEFVETPAPHIFVIAMTTKAEKVPQTLISRFARFDLRPLTQANAVTFLKQACEREDWEFASDALELIAQNFEGQPRLLLRALERVAGRGLIDASNARAVLNLDIHAELAGYIASLVEGDLSVQLKIVADWNEQPTRKLELLRELFVFVYTVDYLKIDLPNILMRGIEISLRLALVCFVERLAFNLALSVDRVWNNLIDRLRILGDATRADLTMVVTKVHFLAHSNAANLIPVSPSKFRATKLVCRLPVGKEIGRWDTWSAIRQHWDLGSFMPQNYGVLFNTQIQLRHTVGGSHESQIRAASAVSDCTRRLADRICDWSGDANSFHWMYRHRIGQHCATMIMAHIQPALIKQAHRWLTDRYEPGSEVEVRFESALASKREQINFHWRGVRSLSRGLHPEIVAQASDGRWMPLVALLGIPQATSQPHDAELLIQSAGSSHTLGPKARAAGTDYGLSFLSAVDDRAWDVVDSGWELAEHRDRIRERAKREGEEDMLRSVHSDGSELSKVRLERALLELRVLWRGHAHLRTRTWKGWWPVHPTSLAVLAGLKK